MKTLTIVAATVWAILLWLFAPKTIWDAELEKAKSKGNKTATETPFLDTETPKTLQDIPEQNTPFLDTETPILEIPILTTQEPTNWTVAKLRKEAQTRKINWKDRDGKPFKKDELMRILEV